MREGEGEEGGIEGRGGGEGGIEGRGGGRGGREGKRECYRFIECWLTVAVPLPNSSRRISDLAVLKLRALDTYRINKCTAS